MKKLFLPLLLLGALLLGGCENRNEAQFRSFSEALRAREDLALTAVVRAEYDDRTCTFTLRCTDEEDGGFCVEVLEPELIRGVRAHMDGGGAKLLYDGISIDTGEDAASQLSPMAALPLLVRALREGMLDSARGCSTPPGARTAAARRCSSRRTASRSRCSSTKR